MERPRSRIHDPSLHSVSAFRRLGQLASLHEQEHVSATTPSPGLLRLTGSRSASGLLLGGPCPRGLIFFTPGSRGPSLSAPVTYMYLYMGGVGFKKGRKSGRLGRGGRHDEVGPDNFPSPQGVVPSRGSRCLRHPPPSGADQTGDRRRRRRWWCGRKYNCQRKIEFLFRGPPRESWK